jgi:hypothetical protein
MFNSLKKIGELKLQTLHTSYLIPPNSAYQWAKKSKTIKSLAPL